MFTKLRGYVLNKKIKSTIIAVGLFAQACSAAIDKEKLGILKTYEGVNYSQEYEMTGIPNNEEAKILELVKDKKSRAKLQRFLNLILKCEGNHDEVEQIFVPDKNYFFPYYPHNLKKLLETVVNDIATEEAHDMFLFYFYSEKAFKDFFKWLDICSEARSAASELRFYRIEKKIEERMRLFMSDDDGTMKYALPRFTERVINSSRTIAQEKINYDSKNTEEVLLQLTGMNVWERERKISNKKQALLLLEKLREVYQKNHALITRSDYAMPYTQKAFLNGIIIIGGAIKEIELQ